MKSAEEINEDKLVILCSCGCNEGYVFHYFDGEIYISLISDYFGKEQESVLKMISKRIRIAFTKDNCIGGPIVSRQDVETIITWLKAHKCNAENYGKLELCSFYDPEDKGTDKEIYELIDERTKTYTYM